jgi:glycine cleavage system transcriptional repressor
VSKAVILTGVGRDRVGIVAELTQALFELGCNLLDSSMTLLRGEFALILMTELPDNVSIERLETSMAALEKQLGMRVHVRSMEPEELLEAEASEENPFIVSVYGADKPGIVAKITRTLSDAGMNITDVQTKSTGSAENKIFVMILEVTAPARVSVATLEQTLRSIGQQMQVDISVQALDVVEL